MWVTISYRTKQLNPQEVGSLVQNETRTEEAAGISWHDHLRRFNMLDPDEQFRKFCESAWIASQWKSNLIMQRENITSWSSRFCSQALENHTEIGPALEVKIFCHLDVHGIEIQVSSTSGWYHCLGGHIPRSKPLRGRVTIQWSRLFSRKPWKSWSCKHSGSWCRTADYSIGASVQSIRRPHSYSRKGNG